MSSIPEPMFQKRRQLSDSCLSGQGIETGALHHPLWVSEQATVRYVDRLSREELRRHYPELPDSFLCAILVERVASHKAQPKENPSSTLYSSDTRSSCLRWAYGLSDPRGQAASIGSTFSAADERGSGSIKEEKMSSNSATFSSMVFT